MPGTEAGCRSGSGGVEIGAFKIPASVVQRQQSYDMLQGIVTPAKCTDRDPEQDEIIENIWIPASAGMTACVHRTYVANF